MHAYFCSLQWDNSGGVEFVTSKVGEKKPSTTCKEYKRNANGSITYIVPKTNKYILTLTKEDGTTVSEDIYGVIKHFKHNVRITKKFREKFEAFMRTRSFSIDSKGMILGIYNSVEEFFRQ